MKLILGSQSPRRKEILSFFSLPFQQVSPHFDEEAVVFKGDPIEYVNTLAKGKLESLAKDFPEQILLTADTVVYREGNIYNKPADEEEAFQILKQLVGNWHSVYTGIAVQYQGKLFQAAEETQVLFNSLTDEQIHTYYHRLPYKDKAGGYSIQQAGSLIVKKIDGCFYNVMGLPINTLRDLLNKAGIDLWAHLSH
jgi:septum formation protein